MDIILLVKLSARAWSLPSLAAFHRGVAGRQAPLLTATGAGRTAFAASLEHLIELGLVARNPGHGHPLRPEFRLTEKGRAAAEAAGEIYGVVSDDAGAAVLRRSWTLPILALTGAPRRFSALRSEFGTITDRALSGGLQALEAQAWLRRDIVIDARMPYPTYCAVGTGARLSQIVSTHG